MCLGFKTHVTNGISGVVYLPDFIRPDRIIILGYFIRGQDPKANSYMRLQPSCPVGCVALYPTAADFRKGNANIPDGIAI